MYNSRMTALLRRRSGLAAVCIAVALLAGGCRAREVEKDLRITDIKTGWYDAGIVDGQNKLVPSISFRLQNISAEAISRVKMNAVFHTVDAPQDAWGDHLIQAIGSNGLEAGATGGALVLRSPRGYTGSEPRLVMLKNSQFVDATVSVFGRHGSRNWIKLGDFRIDRQLLTE
jgi:hypothetical protein